MWKLRQAELAQLRGGGGERFVHFVDRLVRAAAARGRLPQSEILTQLRVNIKDGGVDTHVKQAIPHDPQGWFATPTCWQYKSVDAADIDDDVKKKAKNALQEEINKPHVVTLLKSGCAYRLCILGDLTPQKVLDWEAQLTRESQAISTNAPPPRVIHGGNLLSWAEEFPAIILWLRGMTQGVLHWDAWTENCRALTPKYVHNPEWQSVADQIIVHANLSNPCVDGQPCIGINGAAGVGKTRLVCETLGMLPFAPSLSVYTADEQVAQQLATSLANTPEQSALIVADECSLGTRQRLNDLLRGHAARVRVFCLDNSATRLASRSAQVWLSAEQLTHTEEILAANFPAVPQDRRRQYSRLAGGFVRLAADMCNHDPEISSGDMSRLLASVEEYVRFRLPHPHLGLISLVSLFQKVGSRDDVVGELDALCAVANCSRNDYLNAMRYLKEAPGFIVQAGRYWYVTPEIVARVLFAEGWRRWVAQDPAAFFRAIPGALQQQLVDRAGKLGDEEVRAESAAFFRGWFASLTIRSMSDSAITEFVSGIVETQPHEYLPCLRALIENADAESLLAIGAFSAGSSWGPRRTLVWLIENLVSLPELFDDCESCLFRLAMHETEPNIGNNATAIWIELFGVYLSGTAASFDHRITVLARRLGSDALGEIELAFKALGQVFRIPSGKVVGHPVVAGRLRPRDWQPSTRAEERACYHSALELCLKHLESHSQERRKLSLGILERSVFFLLSKGFLAELRNGIRAEMLSEAERCTLVAAVDEFVQHNEETKRVPEEYVDNVQAWVAHFRPADFDGMLRSVCARSIWDERFAREQGQADDMTAIVEQILQQPAKLDGHLDWLATEEAQAAELLGHRIGYGDTDDRCSESILSHACRTCAAPLSRGYVRGTIAANRTPSEKVRVLIGQLEQLCPPLALELFAYGGDALDGLARAHSLVVAGALPATALTIFGMGVGRRDLTAGEFSGVLRAVVNLTGSGDAAACRIGVRFLSMRLSFETRRNFDQCLALEQCRADSWTLVENALPHLESQHLGHEWSDIVEALSEYDIDRAVRLYCDGLRSPHLSLEQYAAEKLQAAAGLAPTSVMAHFGAALLDPTEGWRFQVGVFREVVASIPEEIVMEWVRSHGMLGARAIARHLPPPYVDDNGQPIVPTLLEMVFREFEDDTVLSAFSAGVHSGESWWGNAAQRFRQEAEEARNFLSHPNAMIREWAKQETLYRTAMAEREELEHQERFLPE